MASMDVSVNATSQEEVNMFLEAEKIANQWFLMGSPIPVLSIVAFYLLFVIKLGPNLMKDRAPLDIKPIILVYNIFQTCFNLYIFSLIFVTDGALSYVVKHACEPMDPAKNGFFFVLNEGSWYFFISKIIDLLDTVFFILRKKQNQVTFLHVYHHANMVLSTWAYLKYVKGENGIIVCVINSFVHVVMYGYYFLAALSPKMQKYLWWKKYITRMQMIQFVIFIVYTLALFFYECKFPRVLSYWIILQAVTFFVLFANFYVQTYLRKGAKKQDKVEKSSDAIADTSENKKES